MLILVFLVKVTAQNLKERKVSHEIYEICHHALQLRWTVFIYIFAFFFFDFVFIRTFKENFALTTTTRILS